MPKKQEKFLKGCGLLWDVAKLLALVALGYLSACPPRSLKQEITALRADFVAMTERLPGCNCAALIQAADATAEQLHERHVTAAEAQSKAASEAHGWEAERQQAAAAAGQAAQDLDEGRRAATAAGQAQWSLTSAECIAWLAVVLLAAGMLHFKSALRQSEAMRKDAALRAWSAEALIRIGTSPQLAHG